jgi:hypothetical protein
MIFEPPHAASSTAHVLAELQMYGYRPFEDEPDPRPLPEAPRIGGAVADIFDAIAATLTDTRLEPDLEALLWSTVNIFHRMVGQVERELDRNEQAQKRSQQEQDGSEIRSVELELIAEGLTLIERRNAYEIFRDEAQEQFERLTLSAWRPKTGSLVSRRTMTASMIDSRDFLNARRRAESELLVPPGRRDRGLDFDDHILIWDRLDKVRAKHPDMVLLHGGSPRARSSSRLAGLITARSCRSLSSRTGPGMPRPRPSAATTPCSIPCRLASSSFPEPASRRIWPTRRSASVSRSCGSEAARERRLQSGLPVTAIRAERA